MQGRQSSHLLKLFATALVLAGVAGCGEEAITSPEAAGDEAPSIDPDIQYDTVLVGDLLELQLRAEDDHGLARIRAQWRDNTPNSVVDTSGLSLIQTFGHTYADSGTYTVQFTVTDTGGNEAIGLAIVWVERPDSLPTVNVVAPDTVIVGDDFRIEIDAHDDRGLDRTVVDFGDGSSGREFVVDQSHCPPTCFHGMAAAAIWRYAYARTFRASVRVIDNAGQEVTVWRTIIAVDRS